MRRPAPIPCLLPNQILGECQIERFLNYGGVSQVYLATHARAEDFVALKVLPGDSRTRRRVARYQIEAEVCSRIEHPNVIFVFEHGDVEGIVYLVMQYLVGYSLYELVARSGGPLSWPFALCAMRQAARGLAAVHREGFVHRDIKPSNIMICDNGRAVLMDFGLVRPLGDAPHANSRRAAGTPKFMSPEQSRGERLDVRSDIFSLGATLYSLLTARPPFRGSRAEVLTRLAHNRGPIPLGEINPTIPRPVQSIVDTALAMDRRQRYSSAMEFCHAIQEALDQVQLAHVLSSAGC